uniref:Uncharacterized protein n=1 Tax=Meloidogyne enterolobii TaxID=390850 RepID=A0A6V7WFD2_MELEN|nr:unnamed protein product [Meloidogyne enterolobii]
MIEKILKEWKIESIKIHCVVTDGANNMKAAFKEPFLSFKHTILNLCVKHSLKCDSEIISIYQTVDQLLVDLNIVTRPLSL